MENTIHDPIIKDELLRRRIRKLIDEPAPGLLTTLSTNPMALLVAGFLLTTIVGTVLTSWYSSRQLEQQKGIEQIKAKQEAGLAAISRISELMYERYTTAMFLASALKRDAPLEEIKERKKLYDDASLKWNTQIQNTQLIVRSITSDSAYSKTESFIQYGLTPHYSMIDRHLTAGYDAALRGQGWHYGTTPVGRELTRCLNCNYAISNYLWTRANLYGNEKNNEEKLVKAEKELAAACPRQLVRQSAHQTTLADVEPTL